VAFREARDLAAQAGDYEAALRVIEAMAAEYTVDAPSAKLAALSAAAKAAATPAANRALTPQALELLDEAVAADNFGIALRLLPLAESLALKSQTTALITQVATRAKEVRELHKEREKVPAATKAPAPATGWKQCAMVANAKSPVRAVAVSGVGAKIYTTDDSAIRVWDRKGTATGSLAGHGKIVQALALSPDGGRLASGGLDRIVKVWNLATGQPTATFTDHTAGIASLAWSADGTLLASAAETVRLFDIPKARQRFAYELPTAGGGTFVRCVRLSPDGQTVAGAVRAPSGGTNVRLFAVGVNGPQKNLDGYDVIAYSSDGKLLATGGCGRDRSSVKVWDTATGNLLHELTGHAGAVRSAVFHPRGPWVFTGGDDGSIRLWDATQGRELGKLEGHSGPVISLALAADGSLLVSGGMDKTARFWSPTGR
jgi:WD40 repeat protein